MAGPEVRVEGLRELQREMRAVERALPRELRAASKEAADVVAEGTRRAFAGLGGSAPKVVPTVKALAQQRGASVKIGGSSSVGGKVALGNEFGSVRYKQFPSWRGSGQGAGYALFPTIRQRRDEVLETYGRALDRVTKRAFPAY